MNRSVVRLALALAVLLALPFAASTSGDSASGRFCYNWGFLNSASQDADGLQASFRGIQSVGEAYTGAWNPFGAPLSGSGYNPKTDAYTFYFGDGAGDSMAYTGDTVYIGFCTAAASLRAAPDGATPAIFWRSGTARLDVTPLFIGVRWGWNGSAGGQVQIFNDQAGDVTIMSASLLDPGEGAALALEDLTHEGAAGLPLLQELINDPLPLAAGATTTLAFSSAAGFAGSATSQTPAVTTAPRPLILELVVASDADPDNTARLYVETSTPLSAYLPLVSK